MSWLSDLLGKTIAIDGESYPDRKTLNLISGEGCSLSAEDNDSNSSTDVTFSFFVENLPEGKLALLGYRLVAGNAAGSFDVSAEDTFPTGVFFRSDGMQMFVVGAGSDSVHQYDLSTAWDVTTAVFDDSFDVSPQDIIPRGLAFQDDGTRMFVMGGNSDSVYQYDLSTAWDVTTAVFDDSFDVSPQDVAPAGLAFQNDGTRMYVTGFSNDNVYQYDLSTAWDVTTAVFDDSFDVSPQDASPRGLTFSADGIKMFVLGVGNDNVYQYDLSTAWDVSTAVFGLSFDLSSEFTEPAGLFFSQDGVQMFVVGSTNNSIFRYITAQVVLGE